MSRTVRRKGGHGWWYGHRDLQYLLQEWRCVYFDDGHFTWSEYRDIEIDPYSKEGKKIVAKFHSDHGHFWNRRGTGEWVNWSCQRPYRAMAKREIQKALQDDEYEAIIPDKPKLGYWD